MKLLHMFFVCGLLSGIVHPLPAQGVDLHQALRDLSGDGVVMDVSAHPDDEDGATLAYYRMNYGISTVSVFLTRGEGGMNEIGPELYGDLGVLRTHETEAAGAIQGSKVFFLNFVDFGFCKNPIEAFHRWGGKKEVVGRLVYALRKFKPDVVITNHNTISGHGHHQAAAIALLDAFDAAADSAMFPEQLREPGISVWQVRKLFFRAPGNKQSKPSDVIVPISQTDPARNTTYVDIAVEALHQHRTQGMDRVDVHRWVRGSNAYTLMRESSSYDDDSTSFFSGIDLWADDAGSPLESLRATIRRIPSLSNSDSLLHGVSRALSELQSLRHGGLNPFDMRMLNAWQETLERIAGLVGGVRVHITPQDSVLVRGQETTLALSLPGTRPDTIRYRFTAPAGWSVRRTPSGDAVVTAGPQAAWTMPQPAYLYTPIDLDQAVHVQASYVLHGIPLTLSEDIPLDVAPPQTLVVEPPVAWLRPGKESVTFTVAVRNFEPGVARGAVYPVLPAGWQADSAWFSLQKENQQEDLPMSVSAPHELAPGEYAVGFGTGDFREQSSVHVFDVATEVRSDIGIVESYDNTLETVAKELGVHTVLLPDAYLANLDLLQFGTIIIDIRAYLVRDALRANNKRLLDYVRKGGNLIVMYQKDQEWKPEYAPFPFAISRDRITLENAPVKELVPDHPLLTKPNLLGDSDWSGWVQERGVYFPADVPVEYQQLLSSHDPDEKPLTTGYIVAKYGKGSYIYTSYVWYRQLKEKNAGAYRAFANMISYPSFRKE
jgi:LmbE family N-acetylglucosaminyl deacetylase